EVELRSERAEREAGVRVERGQDAPGEVVEGSFRCESDGAEVSRYERSRALNSSSSAWPRSRRAAYGLVMLTEAQRLVIKDGVGSLTRDVSLLYYTPDVASAATLLERSLLEEIARQSDRVRLQVLADRWDSAREDAVGIARTPAIVVRGERDYGIRYYGSPDGYELETFLAVSRAVAEGCSGLSAASREALGGLITPLHLEIIVAPT